jgi:3-methyladenine DNA glycosylase AlkD
MIIAPERPITPAAPRKTPARPPSPVTLASQAFVAARRPEAIELGKNLAKLARDPDAFATALETGLAGLADPVVQDGIRSVAPGIGAVLGVRLPLLEAAHSAWRKATRNSPPAHLLAVAHRLQQAEPADMHWFGMWDLERLLPAEPQGAWALMRASAAAAHEWITVDTLAHPWGAGVLRDDRRWAELDALVASTSRWERRLVGSTIATLPHVKSVKGGREAAVVERCLCLVQRLIGDPEPDVQKALSWAIRSMADVDRAATTAFMARETEKAASTADGHRAWVLRDSLGKIDEVDAAHLRAQLEGIRRRPGASPSVPNSSATPTIAARAASAHRGSATAAAIATFPEE